MSLHTPESDPFSAKERQIIFEIGQKQTRTEILERQARTTIQVYRMPTQHCPDCLDPDSTLVAKGEYAVCDICGAKFPHYSGRM